MSNSPLKVFKFLLIIQIILLLPLHLEAQSDCSVPSNLPDHLAFHTNSDPNHSINDDCDDYPCDYTFRVHVYIITASDGTNTPIGAFGLTEEEVVDLFVNSLNDGFDFPDEPYDIEINPNPNYVSDFSFESTDIGYEYISDDEALVINNSYELLENFGRCDAINIFLKSPYEPASGPNNAVLSPVNSKMGLVFHMRTWPLLYDEGSLIHEMGHVFGLNHTWNATPYFNEVGILVPLSGSIQSSTTTEPYGTQCGSTGDYVCDTYITAQSLMSQPPECGLMFQDQCLSRVPLNLDDDCGAGNINNLIHWPVYSVPDELDNTNIMAYAPHPCRNYFSPGQSQRMLHQLECTPALQRASCAYEISPEVYAACIGENSGSIHFGDYNFEDDGLLTYTCLDCNGYQEGYYYDNLASGVYTFQSYLNDCLLNEFTVVVPETTFDFDFISPQIAISTSDFSNQTLSFAENLIIPDGVNLTINNGFLQFADGAGIIIESGGILILNNCEISNHPCSSFLNGIDVQGVSSSPQYGAGSNDQSRLYQSNTTIERARIGIVNYDRQDNEYNPTTSGGIITVSENSKFLNCITAVKMVKYYPPSPGGSSNYRASFSNSEFIWNTDFNIDITLGKPMVDLQRVKRIKFKGCNFLNANPSLFSFPFTHYKKAAIFGIHCSVDIKDGCSSLGSSCDESDVVPSKFEGFNYGIVMMSSKVSSIQETDFNCYRGIWMTNNRVPRITENNFGILPESIRDFSGNINGYDPYWPVHYGVYLDYSNGYWIEANVFDHDNHEESSLGVVIKASGSSDNEMYGNTFNKVPYSTMCYDDNRGTGLAGLKLTCNQYLDVRYAITVTSTVEYSDLYDWGIAEVQGFPGNIGDNPISAGNQFLPNMNDDLINDLEFITYYAVPEDNLDNYTGTTEINFEVEDNGCETQIIGGIGFKNNLALAEKSLADEYREVLNSLIDGGDTQALLTEVIFSDYTEALELYYELMGESPNLSEEVIIESINRVAELPAILLTLILESNPHAAKSGNIQMALDNRSSPLAEYQREQIQAGLSLISSKEQLAGRVSYHQNRYIKYLNQAIILMMEEESITDKLSELYTLIEGVENVDHYYLLADLLIENKDYVGAQNVLSNIATQFNLNPRKDQEYMDFLTVYDILIDHEISLVHTLTPSEKGQLEVVGLKHETRAAGLAIALLVEYNELDHIELLVEPEIEDKRMDQFKPKPKLDLVSAEVRIYPNPAQSFVAIEHIGFKDQMQVQMIDVGGKTVLESFFNGSENIQLLDVSFLENGTYIVVVFGKKGRILQEQIQILR